MNDIESAGGAQQGIDAPALYLNRELSLLAFQERVLAQATRPETPLLARVRFLSISVTNLDEFFEVRVASLREQAVYGVGVPGPDGRTARQTLAEVAPRANALVQRQYAIFNDELRPALAAEGIFVRQRHEWTERQQAWATRYFADEVAPILTPTALDPAHPFPNVVNKRLNFIVRLSGRDALGREGQLAVVTVPSVLPRLFSMPADPEAGAGDSADFVLLSSIIHHNIEALFGGLTVASCHQFRVTRNSDLWVDEEEVDDLLNAIAGELSRRQYGEAMRLEVDVTCPDDIAAYLLDQLSLRTSDLYRVQGPVNLHRIAALCDEVDRPDLKYPPFAPARPTGLGIDADIFARLDQGDILLHHPFESFAPVQELLSRAAADPQVLAIRMTLYRTGADSPVAAALVDAARAGKEVTVVVELRARFDEAANISWANRLKEVGANVVYGMVGFKTHAKLLLVVRRQAGGLKRYIHVGTGNYHARTARLYTDFGLMSSNPQLGKEVHDLFMQLTSFGDTSDAKDVIAAPLSLRASLLASIEGEQHAAERGQPSWIRAKLNSLNDPEIIAALYRASQAGVPIHLVVRGICALRPGVPGVSETIEVRSIVGRFLEHTRIYAFCDNGRERVMISSADWMPRNLSRRVEAAVVLRSPALAKRVLDEGILSYLRDGVDAWQLLSDGTYVPAHGEGPSTQLALLQQLCGFGEPSC